MTDKLDVLQGTLDLILLKLLQAGPANGWDLTRSIQTVSKGVLDVNYGSIYPALRRLESKGLVAGSWAASDNNRRARSISSPPPAGSSSPGRRPTGPASPARSG